MAGAEIHEFARTANREEAAAVLNGVGEGLLAGAVHLGDPDDGVVVELPDEFALEVEYETEDGVASLEVEMEWPTATGDGDETDVQAGDDETGDPTEIVAAADAEGSQARFELFRDRADEWRWRLRHRNGNVVATSGEGYVRKIDARNGLQSVMANAPGAAVHEETPD